MRRIVLVFTLGLLVASCGSKKRSVSKKKKEKTRIAYTKKPEFKDRETFPLPKDEGRFVSFPINSIEEYIASWDYKDVLTAVVGAQTAGLYQTLKGTTLGINLDLDSALIKITDEGSFSFVEMAEANDIEEGQWVVATGHPGGVMKNRSAPARLGRVLFTNSKVVCTDCALVGGDSGGPLLDLDGRVVGVHSRIGWQVTTNFHVPVGTYHDTWDQLASSAVLGEEPSWEDDTRPVLGITGDPLAENCRIAQIFPGLPAADAGLHVGDVVVEVDGHDVARFDDLINHVLRKRPGDTIALHVLRGEQRIEVEVTLSNQRRPLPGSAERSDESPEDQADEEQPEEEPDDSQDTTPEEDAEDGSEQEDAEGD